MTDLTLVSTIVSAVAWANDMTSAAMMTRTHRHAIAHPRQMAMFLVHELRPDLSFPRIGRAFGGYDHTTIMAGISATERRLKVNPGLAEILDVARRRLIH